MLQSVFSYDIQDLYSFDLARNTTQSQKLWFWYFPTISSESSQYPAALVHIPSRLFSVEILIYKLLKCFKEVRYSQRKDGWPIKRLAALWDSIACLALVWGTSSEHASCCWAIVHPLSLGKDKTAELPARRRYSGLYSAKEQQGLPASLGPINFPVVCVSPALPGHLSPKGTQPFKQIKYNRPGSTQPS